LRCFVEKAVILAGARTPIGSFLGALSSLSAVKLGSIVIEEVIKRSKMSLDDIDEVIMGQVLQGGAGQAPARQASIGAGLSSRVPCVTINKVCGSGLKAVMMAADSISLGHNKIVVAGGMESMSNAPYILPSARIGFRMGNKSVVDLMIYDGLFDPYKQEHMGSFGDMCAREYGISRAEQDQYAISSYQRANKAQAQGLVNDEIVPVSITNKGVNKIVSIDEEPARYQPEKVSKLPAAFNKDGTVTAANASKINDGAAAVIVASEEIVKEKHLSAQARIIASSTFAHDPQWFTTAPVMAIKNVLKKASLQVSDIDLFEINEAFSVVSLVAIKELSLKREQVNVYGGAVALGHPIGCSGARLLVTLINALNKQKSRYGCVSLCLGGGEAVAMIIERIS
jgi:acetyl-CoA C-acetyltransferase